MARLAKRILLGCPLRSIDGLSVASSPAHLCAMSPAKRQHSTGDVGGKKGGKDESAQGSGDKPEHASAALEAAAMFAKMKLGA